MNTTQSLTLPPASSALAAATAQKEEALTLAAMVARVSCAEEQLAAVEAQKALAAMLNYVESERVRVKEPGLRWCKQVDQAAKDFVQELREEKLRVDRLVADFQALEMAKVRAAEAVERERLNELEREKQRALAEAKSIEQVDAIQQEFCERVAEAAPPLVVERVEGQIVKEEWVFEVFNGQLLAASHPHCVKIEPRLLELKELIGSVEPAFFWVKVSNGKADCRERSEALKMEGAENTDFDSGTKLLMARGWRWCAANIRGVLAWKETRSTVRAGQPMRRIG